MRGDVDGLIATVLGITVACRGREFQHAHQIHADD